ncbi:hypothetical protein EBZ39_00030 [bacterium]|nr:hypothetical protein [bacterium]
MDEQQPQGQTSDRLPFDVEFYKLSEEFCTDAIKKVPELAGVAIIPVWLNQPENTPTGLLKLRNHQPPYLAGLLALLGRIVAFATDVHRDFIGQLKMFDQYAAELANQIKERLDMLERVNKIDSPAAEATNDQQ